MSLLDTASLIVTPNGYKEGKLYSVIPSDGSGDMSVVRATTATRVNSSGLVELVPYNLVRYSEQFDNAAWTKIQANGGSAPIVTANYGISPDGTQNADRIQLTRTADANSYSYVFQEFTATIGQPYTWSVWLKSLSGTPSVALTYKGSGAYSNIVTLSNEWERYEFTINATGTACQVLFLLFENLPSTSLTADFLAYGFQANEGSTALPYQKTETRLNIPRLDYSNGTCPSLLVEPQRTNLVTYSSSFDNAAWAKVPLGGTALTTVVTANDTISPSGIQDADKIFMSLGGGTTTSDWARLQSQTFNQTSGTSYTISFWAWASQSSEVGKIVRVGIGGNTALLDFTLTANATRFTVTYTAAATGTDSLLFQLRGAQGLASTAEFYLWGAQLESGNYGTSYIPTTSASVTRNADVISKTGISSLIGQTEGTIFFEGVIYGENPSVNRRILSISNGTTATAINIQTPVLNSKIEFEVTNGGATQVFISAANNSLVYGQNFKAAFAYKANDFVAYINGVQIGTDTNGTVPTCDKLSFDRGNNTSNFEGSAKAATLWKTRLTNDELATLTTI